PSRPRQRGLRLRRPHRGPRPHRRRRRHRRGRPRRRSDAARLRSPPRGSRRGMTESLAARARLRHRPLRETVSALAAAARRWCDDASLRAALPAAARLSPAMVDAVLPIVADMLDEESMTALVEQELGPGAAERPAPDGPALVAHVLASNV